MSLTLLLTLTLTFTLAMTLAFSQRRLDRPHCGAQSAWSLLYRASCTNPLPPRRLPVSRPRLLRGRYLLHLLLHPLLALLLVLLLALLTPLLLVLPLVLLSPPLH